jgi:hypothetical protein
MLVESNFGLRHIGSMEDTLEQMARSLVESGLAIDGQDQGQSNVRVW